MELFKDRIKKLRIERDITQSELAEYMGFKTYTTVSKWESGDNLPRGKELKKLAELFNVSSDYILGISDNREIKQSSISTVYNLLDADRKKKVYKYAKEQLDEQHETELVLVYGQTAAGEPISYGDPEAEEKEVSKVPKGADMALLVKGDSMEDLIPDGSLVFYKRQPSVDCGDIAIVEIEGDGVTCKRIKYDYDNQKIILQSENDKYDDVALNNDQIRILGKVIL